MIEIIQTTIMITGFVFVMMLVIEYVNVLTSGRWRKRIMGHKWRQYVLAALLGATPGCMGAFAVVALYSHRIVTIGAVVAAMIATSGDEAFVMLAVIPKEALLLFGGLFVLGIGGGALTDIFTGRRTTGRKMTHVDLEIHPQERPRLFSQNIFRQWKECSACRGILAIALALLIFGTATGYIGHHHIFEPASETESREQHHEHENRWGWETITLLAASLLALFIVITVPEHFLEEHLWKHVARKHVPKIFLWTLGVLIVMHLLSAHLDLGEAIAGDHWVAWTLLAAACLVGIIPESGPHLIFVMLFWHGEIPFSILLAGSIVQDGHGMLPMLAHSRKAFIVVKAINFAVGAACGAALLGLGF